MKLLKLFSQWFDSSVKVDIKGEPDRIDLTRIIPFIFLHIACLGVIWVGWSWPAVITAFVLYFLRMFAITGFYHRYFSHRCFKTSRFIQFVFAALGNASAQRGPIWWSSHHVYHHLNADKTTDTHSPMQQGFLWSHLGWFMSRANFNGDTEKKSGWYKFPELRLIDRFDTIIPMLLFLGLYGFGFLLQRYYSELGAYGWQMVIWGGCISTVAVMHSTFSVNSFAHMFGKRRFDTEDTSRNSFIIAILTLGEGWHNNHHYCANAASQGFFWWEIDITYYILKTMSVLGLIKNLRPVPEKVIKQGIELNNNKSSV